MAVVLKANPKGGAAKTTTTLLIALSLCRYGKSVCIIDADPEHWISAWSKLPGKPENLKIINNVDEYSIIDAIEEHREKFDFVLIDPEGTAGLLVQNAAGMADFVVIPCQGSSMDARGASKTIKMIKATEKIARGRVPYAVLLTRTGAAIETRALKHVRDQLQANGIEVFNTQLVERTVYRDLFDYGGTLHDMDPKTASNLDKAIDNANAITKELVNRLIQTTQEDAA